MHRFWCWPQRSSHGRDQLGYRSCTLTRGPAPKSTTTLFCVFFLLFFLRKSRGEVLKKNAGRVGRVRLHQLYIFASATIYCPRLQRSEPPSRWNGRRGDSSTRWERVVRLCRLISARLGDSLCHRLEEKSIRLVLRICGHCSHGNACPPWRVSPCCRGATALERLDAARRLQLMINHKSNSLYCDGVGRGGGVGRWGGVGRGRGVGVCLGVAVAVGVTVGEGFGVAVGGRCSGRYCCWRGRRCGC